MKQCNKCKKNKSDSEFYYSKVTKIGLTARCKECMREAQRSESSKRAKAKYRKTEKYKNAQKKYRLSVKGQLNYRKCLKKWQQSEKGKESGRKWNKIRKKKFPEKVKCVSDLNHAIRDKKITKRNVCEICLNSPTECHHEDYSKALEIIELCVHCHHVLHQQYRNKSKEIEYFIS
jgi:hypothetical protein